MPQSIESKEFERIVRDFKASVMAAVKQGGFARTLKSLNKGRLPAAGIATVLEGTVEESASGLYDAALNTDKGRVVLRNAQRTDRSTDPQLVSSREDVFFAASADIAEMTADELLRQLRDAGPNPPCRLLCVVELTRFKPSQHEVLLPLLWQYILAHRDSNDRDELVAAGAAIRKYIAIMPMDRMGELAVLLESGHRSPLPIDLEIEVAKMIFRNFEVHPPVAIDTQPELAQRLLEMVHAYLNPRILLRDKHSAAASLAVDAIVAMRSSLAVEALQEVAQSPYRWFAELVSDDLDDLHETWRRRNPEAADWLGELRDPVSVHA